MHLLPLQLHNRQQCHHVDDIPLQYALLYCLTLSSFFVGSLYAFVPSKIRCLSRDNVTHIKWRTAVTLAVMIIGVAIYPFLFCQQLDTMIDDMDVSYNPPWYKYLGFTWQPIQDIKIITHVLILYLGSFLCSWLKVYHRARILQWEESRISFVRKSARLPNNNAKTQQQLTILTKPKYLYRSLHVTWILPIKQSFQSFINDEGYRWITLRNLGIAPLVEEVIFRACVLPPLLASSLSPTKASWTAPLFFGVAHLHHFYEKYRHIPPIERTNKIICHLLLVVAVQWTYTTLFGAYESHVFVRTGSLSGVVLAHMLCNYMGLPDISFTRPSSSLYGYFWGISIMYLFGIGMFIVGFNSFLFPKESVIISLLLHQY